MNRELDRKRVYTDITNARKEFFKFHSEMKHSVLVINIINEYEYEVAWYNIKGGGCLKCVALVVLITCNNQSQPSEN